MSGPTVSSKYKPPPPTMRLSGKHVKSLTGTRVGEQIGVMVHGKLVSHSLGGEYEGDQPSMTIQMHRVHAKRIARARHGVA